MARDLNQLRAECQKNGIEAKISGKKETKEDYEVALRDFYWERDHGQEPMLPQLAPMLGKNVKDLKPAKAEQVWAGFWVQEKVNGCRGVLHICPSSQRWVGVPATKDENRMTSRRISDQTFLLNENTDNVAHIRDFDFGEEWEGTVVDGELISPVACIDTESVHTHNVLQSTVVMLNCSPEKSARLQVRFGLLKYMMFDILFFKGQDVRGFSYESRYAMLQKFAEAAKGLAQMQLLPILHTNLSTVESKMWTYEEIVKTGGEGVMLKDPNGTYCDVGHSDRMYKVKRFVDQDAFVIAGERGESGKGQENLIAILIFGAYKLNADGSKGEVIEVGRTAAFTLVEKEGWTLRHPGGQLSLNPNVLGNVYELRGEEWTARTFKLSHCVPVSQRFDKAMEDCVVDIEKIKQDIADRG